MTPFAAFLIGVLVGAIIAVLVLHKKPKPPDQNVAVKATITPGTPTEQP